MVNWRDAKLTVQTHNENKTLFRRYGGALVQPCTEGPDEIAFYVQLQI